MTGMKALRLRGEEKKKLIKYDIIMFNHKELKILENCLYRYKVDYWFFNGDLYTYDKERFDKALLYYLYDEEK